MTTTACTFCGEPLDIAFATTLVLFPPSREDGSQALHCHGACLEERVHSSIPLHPGLEDA